MREYWLLKSVACLQVLDIQIDRTNKIGGVIPRVLFKDKGSYTESSTKEYDMLAFKYLSWALYPLLGGYAVYSLMYNEHRGWYSFVLNMLYGFLLTFGKFSSLKGRALNDVAEGSGPYFSNFRGGPQLLPISASQIKAICTARMMWH